MYRCSILKMLRPYLAEVLPCSPRLRSLFCARLQKHWHVQHHPAPFQIAASQAQRPNLLSSNHCNIEGRLIR